MIEVRLMYSYDEQETILPQSNEGVKEVNIIYQTCKSKKEQAI
jgi:hypothetical protein